MLTFIVLTCHRSGDNGVYVRQRDLIKDAIETYGVDHIAGVTVGNEFMLKSVNALCRWHAIDCHYLATSQTMEELLLTVRPLLQVDQITMHGGFAN